MLVFLAQATAAVPPITLPDPNHFSSIGWVLVILTCLILSGGGVLDVINKHLREQPKPSETYVTIPNFKEIEQERKDDREKIMRLLGDIKKEMDNSNRYQAKARQAIHHRQNAMENALSFVAGRYEHDGDHSAAQAISQKLHEGRTGGGNYDGE